MIKFNGTNWEEVISKLNTDVDKLKKDIEDWLADADLEGPLKIGDSEITEDELVDFMIDHNLFKNGSLVMTSENDGHNSGFDVEKVGGRKDFYSGNHLAENNPHSNSAHEGDIDDIPVENHNHNTQHDHLGAAKNGHNHEDDYADALPRVNEAHEAEKIEGLDLDPGEEILTDEDSFPIPVGTIVWYAGDDDVSYSTAHSIDNFLVCNGALLNENTYSELHGVIGTSYGSGVDSFRIPDLGGLFIKGAIDNIGSSHEDSLVYHEHDNVFQRTETKDQTSNGLNRWYNIDSNKTTGATGYESRPKNISMIPLIKYKSQHGPCVENSYFVRFIDDTNNQMLFGVPVEEGGDISVSSSVDKIGHNFVEYDPSEDYIENEKSVFTDITEHRDIHVIFERKEYTVTFEDYDGSVLETQTVLFKDSADEPNEPTRQNYHFVGWDNDFDEITEDVTITALYKDYLVTFINHNGETIKSVALDYGENATPPTIEEAKVDGFELYGWDKSYTNVTEDMTIEGIYVKTPIVNANNFKAYSGEVKTPVDNSEEWISTYYDGGILLINTSTGVAISYNTNEKEEEGSVF